MRTEWLVFGDSHVRSFCNRPGVIPVFLAPGRRFNYLDSRNAQLSTEDVDTILAHSLPGDRLVLLYGEALVRFAMLDAWQHSEAPSRDAREAAEIIRRDCAKAISAWNRIAAERRRKIVLLTPPPALQAGKNDLIAVLNEAIQREIDALGPSGDDKIELICGEFDDARPLRAWYSDVIHCTQDYGAHAVARIAKRLCCDHPEGSVPAPTWPDPLPSRPWLTPHSQFLCYVLAGKRRRTGFMATLRSRLGGV